MKYACSQMQYFHQNIIGVTRLMQHMIKKDNSPKIAPADIF